MEPVIDENVCIGCGRCMEICPTVFFLEEEGGTAEVMDPEACEFAGCCEAAEENCPVGAISIEE